MCPPGFLGQAGCSSFELSSEVRLCSSSNKRESWSSKHGQRSRIHITAAKGPPKQGRGYNAKKAAAEGIQRRMRGRDGDLDGWTMVRPEILKHNLFFSVDNVFGLR